MPYRKMLIVRLFLAVLGLFLAQLPVAHATDAKQQYLLSKYGTAKVSSGLLQLYDVALERGSSLSTENVIGFDVAIGQPLRLFAESGSGILVDLVVDDVTEAILEGIAATGAEIVAAYPAYRRVSASVDTGHALLSLGTLAGVRRVQSVFPPDVRAGSVTSRAVTALNTTNASATHGVDGTGTMVGIVSDSFAHTAGVRDGNTAPATGVAGTLTGSIPQDSGDLPASVTLLSDAVGGTDEGAAMAELVHDIAPGAAIAFHDHGPSEAGMATAIDNLCGTPGMSVVVDDIGFFAEAFYQDDLIAQAATRCFQAGIPYFSAEGNSGDDGFRERYRDINEPVDNTTFPADGSDLHDWDPGGTQDGFLGVLLQPGVSVLAILQWNQPHDDVSPGAGAQYDLDLYETTAEDISTIIDFSTDIQGETGSPGGNAVEIVQLVNTTGAPLVRYLAVDHWRGNQDFIPQGTFVPVEFRLVLVGPTGGFTTEYPGNGPTTWGHPYAHGVVGVAAVPWWEAPSFDPSLPPTSNIDPEPFTSRGSNVPVQFNAAGSFINSTRSTPVLAASDANNTTFFGINNATPALDGEDDGFPNFFGTSAAAPNAAAVAALMLEFDPTLTPVQIRDAMTSTAIDVTGSRAATGPDDVTGAGLLDALAALNALLPPPPDTVPDNFSFIDVTGVEINTVVVSSPVTITGITAAANISVTGGEYSIDCTGTFVSTAGTINNGQSVCVRHTSSSAFNTNTDTTLTVGTVSDTFTSTTLPPPDTTPNPFAFTDANNVLPSTQVVSGQAAISGINRPTDVSVQNGEYSIGCNSSFTSLVTQIQNGQRVCVRHMSASGFQEANTTTLTIGGVSASFTSVTQAQDAEPNAFAFATRTNVEPQSLVRSEIITIGGFNTVLPVSIKNGEYSINCQESAFTGNNGQISPGQTVCVRHQSASGSERSKTTRLTVGGVNGEFTSVTRRVISASGSSSDGTPIEGSGGLGGSKNSGSGCAMGSSRPVDPMFYMLLLISMLYVRRKAFSRN